MEKSRMDLFKGVLVTVMWGANFSVIEMGLKDLDPFALTFLRFLFCAFPLVFFIKKPAGVSWLNIALYGVLFGVGFWWVVNFAMYNGLSAGLSAVLLQFSVFFTIILSYIFFKEELSFPHVIGMFFSFAGLISIVVFSKQDSTIIGVFLVLLAAISWAFCNIIIKLSKPSDMMGFIIWSSLFSAPAILIMTVFIKGVEPIFSIAKNITPASGFSVLFQAYITTILGYIVWNNLIKKYEASVVAPLSLIVPVSGIISSYLFLDERLEYGQLLSLGIIIFGVSIFINAKKLQRKFFCNDSQ